MQQDDEPETPIQAEQRRYWAYYDKLHRCRRWNSSLAELRKLAWFAWGAVFGLWLGTVLTDGATAWILCPVGVVFAYTALVHSVLKPNSEEEVAKWLQMVHLEGFDTRGDIEDLLIPYMEAERLVKEGWLTCVGEGWYKPKDCDWDVLLGGHARGWRRLE